MKLYTIVPYIFSGAVSLRAKLFGNFYFASAAEPANTIGIESQIKSAGLLSNPISSSNMPASTLKAAAKRPKRLIKIL